MRREVSVVHMPVAFEDDRGLTEQYYNELEQMISPAMKHATNYEQSPAMALPR